MSTDARHIPDREELKRRLAEALRQRSTRKREGQGPRKIKAITIAIWLQLKPECKHEVRRRRVRELVDELRQDGVPIASDFSGYWLAVEPADHARYQEFMKRMGLTHLVNAAADKRAPLTAEQGGQLRMFAD